MSPKPRMSSYWPRARDVDVGEVDQVQRVLAAQRARLRRLRRSASSAWSWRDLLAQRLPQRGARRERRAPPAFVTRQESRPLQLHHAFRRTQWRCARACRASGARRRRGRCRHGRSRARAVRNGARLSRACATSSAARSSSAKHRKGASPSSAATCPAVPSSTIASVRSTDDRGECIDPRLIALSEDVTAPTFSRSRPTVCIDQLLCGQSAVRFRRDDDINGVRPGVGRDLWVGGAQHVLADHADECRLALCPSGAECGSPSRCPASRRAAGGGPARATSGTSRAAARARRSRRDHRVDRPTSPGPSRGRCAVPSRRRSARPACDSHRASVRRAG